MSAHQAPNEPVEVSPQDIDAYLQRRSRRRKLLLLSGLTVAALSATTYGGYALGRHSASTSDSVTESKKALMSDATYTAPITSKRRNPATIVGANFQISIVVTDKKCFGSAGCNVRYTINPTYVGSPSDLVGRSLTVIYEVNGGEQSQVGNFTLRGTQMSYDDAMIQTSSSDAEITAVATRVISN